MQDAAALIRASIPIVPVPLIPEIKLHMAERAEVLAWAPADPAPYWAYVWAGGAAAARHVLDHPATVRGLRVLDLGAGSGIVGIAAALSGAMDVRAAETDPLGRTAIALNAAANGVTVAVIGDDLLAGPAPDADIVLAGDMLYDRELSHRVIPYLFRCREAGLTVIIGDPGRGLLPPARRLRELGSYGSGSVDDDRDGPTTPAAVYAME
jgi:predicted nicotinamide N-methyase